VLPTFLNLPPIPDSIKSMITQTPSSKSMFDFDSSKYDPPGNLDLNDLPQ